METKVKRGRLKKAPGSYRHGDLANALLDIAGILVSERGGPDFTLREIADRVGVSHPAVYRHYGSRDQLVSALAARTFDRMRNRFDDIRLRAAGDFSAWLEGLARVYFDIVNTEPGAYRVMFAASSVADERRDAAAMACFNQLVECFALGQQKRMVRNDVAPMAIAASNWAAFHGMATLILDKRLKATPGSGGLPDIVQLLREIQKNGWSPRDGTPAGNEKK